MGCLLWGLSTKIDRVITTTHYTYIYIYTTPHFHDPPCCLGCQSRAPWQPCIDLDDAVLEGLWMQCILNVTLADDAEVPDHLDGRLSQHVVLLVGQSLTGSYDNGISWKYRTGPRFTKGFSIAIQIQLCCRGMCKIFLWSDGQQQN